MGSKNYPIILGRQYRKGILAVKDGSGFKFVFCRLKKEYEAGEKFEPEDIESVEKELWFCDRESLEITVKIMNEVLEMWK